MMYSNFFPEHEDSGTPFAIAKNITFSYAYK